MNPTILTTALTLLSIRVATPILSLAIKCHHLTPATPGYTYPAAFKNCNLAIAVTTEITNLQRRATTEFFKESRAPLRNSFLIVIVKDVSSGPS